MFPDSFSKFEYFDVDKAFDLNKILTHIALTVNSNADELLSIKQDIQQLRKVGNEVEKDVIEIVTKQGWKVIA